MFQFARLSLACPWIQQQFERLSYSKISGATLIFYFPKHFLAYYAIPPLWVPSMEKTIDRYQKHSKGVNVIDKVAEENLEPANRRVEIFPSERFLA